MKTVIKMALAITIAIAFMITVLPLSNEAAAESDIKEELDLWGWQGDDDIAPVTIVDNGKEYPVKYFINESTNLKYQTRLILKQNNENIYKIPNSISSMAVRFIEFETENDITTLKILNEYKVSQFDFYDHVTLSFGNEGYKPGSASNIFKFGVSVMHYDDVNNPSSAHAVYLNIDGRATMGKLDLDKYLLDPDKSLIFNWHNQSIEQVIKKINPSEIDKSLDGISEPVIGEDYYWTVEESTPVAKNVNIYKATAIALKDSKYYEGTAKDRTWEIKIVEVDPKCEKLTYNGTIQMPQPTITKKVSYYTIDTKIDSAEYGKLIKARTTTVTLYFNTDFKLNDTNGQMDANVYSGADGYSIEFINNNDGNVCTSTDRYSWEIQRKEIRDEFICDANYVPITPDTFNFEYTGEPITLNSITVVDSDLKGFPRSISKSIGTFDKAGAKVLIGYIFDPKEYGLSYEIQIEPGIYTITVTVDEDKCVNYKGVAHAEYKISNPEPLIGEIHVNIIWTNGTLTSAMFDDSNTFIYPYEPDYRTYDDDMNYIGKTHPTVMRENLKLVVLDARGNVVIDEIAGINEGTTQSEWNHIEAYGTKGFKGCITGEFYVAFNNVYEIGSTFSEDGLVYTVTSLDNKTVSVTGYETGIQAGVAIPDYVEGFKVTKIGTKAFYGCKTITSVDLGENITSVGIKAFANCTKLETVVFDDALKTISAYAFYNCGKLTSIDLPDKVRTIGSYAFYKCNALTSVSFDDALKTVGTKAFTVSFENASGKVIKQTAKNLAGKTFEGSDKVLKLVA